MLSNSTSVANSVCDLYDEQKVVCPVKLRKNVFTTGQMDNIDHNPSAPLLKTHSMELESLFYKTYIMKMQVRIEMESQYSPVWILKHYASYQKNTQACNLLYSKHQSL